MIEVDIDKAYVEYKCEECGHITMCSVEESIFYSRPMCVLCDDGKTVMDIEKFLIDAQPTDEEVLEYENKSRLRDKQ